MTCVTEFAHRSVVLQIFNPIIRILQIGGVTVGPTIRDESLEEDGSLESRVFKVGIGQWIYSIIVVHLLWTFAAGYLHKLVFLTPMTSPWVITFMYFIMGMSTNVIATLSCLTFCRGSFQKFINQCYVYEQTYGISQKSAKLVSLVRKSIAGYFLQGLFAMCAFIFLHWLYEGLERNYFAFPKRAWINYVFVCLELTATSLTVNGVMLSISTTSMFLCNELDIITDNFKTLVNNETNDRDVPKIFEKCITDLINRHDKLCTLIDRYSENSSFYVCISLFLSLPIFCFTVYVMLTIQLSSYANGLCYFILVLCLVPSTMLCILGSRVNVKAHEPLTYLWQIPTSELTAKTVRELMLFCTRLTSTSIGISMYGFFIISPPAVLTIVGTIATYFVVVLQFKPSDLQTCDDILANFTTLLQAIRNITDLNTLLIA